ncbi:FAD-binding protein, partial [Herbaspirillum sp. B65]|uniref:FAD-binding protein n=1 Tax=Herbaspirillum sp. B65 TaxID=137708 RepID=UPI0035B51F84
MPVVATGAPAKSRRYRRRCRRSRPALPYRCATHSRKLPETEAQVVAILRTCHALQVQIVPRGAGTGLSGGAMPIAD